MGQVGRWSKPGPVWKVPRHSRYAIYAYIDPQNHPNVGIYIYMAYMECLGWFNLVSDVSQWICEAEKWSKGLMSLLLPRGNAPFCLERRFQIGFRCWI